MRSMRTAAAALAILVLAASPALACRRQRHDHKHQKRSVSWQRVLFNGIDALGGGEDAVERSSGPKDLSAYEGLGSWIDIFNHKPWAHPARAVRRMHERGAKAIFLQTSTYGQRRAIHDGDAVDAYLRHAHRLGMKVVAWYVPAFDQQRVDFRRIRQAIRYRSPSGDRFDSFGLDIEATNVRNVAVRNHRLLELSKRIRNLAGPDYALGAITPDPVEALYWPNFPYKRLAKVYDVFVPMGYFTFRADGYEGVRRYTETGIKAIRRETGDREVPIHFIGGIADDAGALELKGFVKAARDHGIEGASLYDYPTTDRKSWFEMRALSKGVAARRRQAAADAAEKGRTRTAERERKKQRGDAKDRGKRNKKAGTRDDRKARGRRSPSSSASRRDSESLRERERERRRLHSGDRRPRRS